MTEFLLQIKSVNSQIHNQVYQGCRGQTIELSTDGSSIIPDVMKSMKLGTEKACAPHMARYEEIIER